ncbi:MAG: hypothetical protein C5B50_12595 [Verrucomicrobia bacterium]|nr:MAG: hypothetical protein C5B50_12595 [Verrucomicrobiota bacterium]
MRSKKYTVRSLTLGQDKNSSTEFNLEFEGKRAFVIWDSFALGDYRIEARMEIDPMLLQEAGGKGSDFLYCGEIILPKPENN